MGSIIGLYFVDKVGRRPLTLISLLGVILSLLGIAYCFFNAQQSSQKLTGDFGGSDCSDYEWCFDCVQDEACGFCSIEG